MTSRSDHPNPARAPDPAGLAPRGSGRVNTFTIDPSPSSGATISINGQAVLTIEPIGTPEQPPVGATEPGQHFIATPLVGPDAGRQTRIPPSPHYGHIYRYDSREHLRPATEADRHAAHLPAYDPTKCGPGIASPVFYSTTDGLTVVWDSRPEAFAVLPGRVALTPEEHAERSRDAMALAAGFGGARTST